MMNNKDLAMHLRCSEAEPEDRLRKCDQTCPYYEIEEEDSYFIAYSGEYSGGKTYCAFCNRSQIIEDAAQRIEKLETEKEKYRWHDLRKTPGDLPECAGYPVMVALIDMCGNQRITIGFQGYGDFEWYTMSVEYFRKESSENDNRISKAYKVIAWREIEPFEGKEE